MSRSRFFVAGVLAGVFACAVAVRAADKKTSSSKQPAQDEMAKPDDAMSDKDKPASKDEKAAPAKFYRFKGEKKGGGGDGQVMTLLVEDVFNGKSETFNVPNNEPATGKYDPLTPVADAVKGFAPNDIIEVRTERQRGRTVAVEVSKADVTPGEDRPNGYVFLGWDRQKTGDGDKVMGLKLRKFGREIVAMVPLTKNSATGDWNPSGQVDYVLGRVQPGEAIEATFKPGKPPVLQEIFEYYPPERGKFIEFTQAQNGGVVTAAFKMTSGNETLTISLPGVERQKGATKFLMPDAKQLQLIKRLKPDTEIEVYLRGRNDYILREIKVLAPPPPAAGKTEARKS